MKRILPTAERILVILFLLLSLVTNGQTNPQTYTTSGTFTVPAGVTQITVEAWGGGGKGGTQTTTGSGGGGGGGAYAKKLISVTPGNTYTVTVGKGATTTSPGGDSWFWNNTTILAGGGSSVSNNTINGANGGVASFGDINLNGGNGADGVNGSYGGGGGSSAGTILAGVSATDFNGAIAPTGGGNGGDGKNGGSGNGNAGAGIGGGGGGAKRTSGTRNGGYGADGKIIISWDASEINLQGNSNDILNNSITTNSTNNTDFGSCDVDLGTIVKTFTIQNTGTLTLNIGAISISGTHAADYNITLSPASSVAPGGSTTFEITFNPGSTGSRNATISIVNDDSDENPYTFDITGFGIQDTDLDGVDNSVDLDDDNDGILDSVECSTCTLDPFVNGSFETPVLPPTSFQFVPVANVTGWQTSPENVIEIWSTGFNGVPAANGNQFAELNANVPGTLYQTFCLSGQSGTIDWSIKHRGRSGVDQAFVKFGTSLADAQASSPVATMVDGNTAWGTYSGTYVIPAGQTQIVLAFQAGYTASGNQSIGNFIDDIHITINQGCIDTDGDGIVNSLDLDDDNDGIPDIEEGGFKAYSNNSSTIDMSNPVLWMDANHNGFNDYIEAMVSNGTYNIPDTDGDGSANYIDLDSDNDSLFDVDEAGLLNGDGDINGDGFGDLVDTDEDGILDLYDNNSSFGTNFRPYAQDTDGNGTPDFLQLDSNNDGIKDIQTGLYGNLDGNNDGKIDGSTDSDKDGITDTFDTDTTNMGSPRDLNRKLYLDFDGRNDYAEDTPILGGLPQATLMAWIDLSSTFSSTGVIAGQDKFQIRITAAKKLEVVINSTILTCNTLLSTNRWYHVAAVYGNGTIKLFINGKLSAWQTLSGNINADASNLTLGKNPSGFDNYFNGKIDEVRVFNLALSDDQVHKMVYQEIENNSSQVRGAIIPRDIDSLPFANVLRYFRMDTFKDDIIDDLTTPTVDVATGMKMYNHKVINYQQAPMPFVTLRTGNFATAVNNAPNDVRGQDIMDQDWSIVLVKHNINQYANNVDLGMFVDSGITINMNNNTKIQNDWYLKLDGKIDLVGKSQLVQTEFSELDVTSSGYIERDQQGQSNKFNYNYWSSPVSTINTNSVNNGYTIAGVMKDGTDPNNIKNIQWTSGYNGSPTDPITLSNYWIYKFQNLNNNYANWTYAGQNGNLNSGYGYTLKGSGTGTANQNYTFVGKPNNGTITIPVSAENLNLCGNPYASAIDADKFISDNLDSISGTLYFWEHYDTNSSHNYSEYQGGYATRTLVGSTPPVAPDGVSGLGSSSKTPERFIPVGQGFFVEGSATGGNVVFNNTQRVFVKEDNATSFTMFKSKDIVNKKIDPDFINDEDTYEEEKFIKVRLGFVSNDNFHRQILLGFMNEHASSGYDNGYDATNFDERDNDMYFINNSTQLNIQGEGYFNENNSYPIGIKTKSSGNIQIKLDASENFENNQAIYIYDNVTDTYQSLKEGIFEIDLPKGTFDDRFSLVFRKSATLSTTENEFNQNIKMFYTSTERVLNIQNNSSDFTVKSVSLYNVLGQTISTWNIENQIQNNIQLPVNNTTIGTYIVKVVSDNGSYTKKIIVE